MSNQRIESIEGLVNMRIQSQICHIDEKRVIAKVSGWNDSIELGSAHGEGKTIEEAEDRAIRRLSDRLSQTAIKKGRNNTSPDPRNNNENRASSNISQVISGINKIKEVPSISKNENNNHPISKNTDQYESPLDWSDELTCIDNELKRIGWEKNDESIFLERLFGYQSRNKILRYSDLTLYLIKLKELTNGQNISLIDIKYSKDQIIDVSNAIIKKFDIDPKKARDLLSTNFNVNSRAQLNEENLSKYNYLLEDKLT